MDSDKKKKKMAKSMNSPEQLAKARQGSAYDTARSYNYKNKQEKIRGAEVVHKVNEMLKKSKKKK